MTESKSISPFFLIVLALLVNRLAVRCLCLCLFANSNDNDLHLQLNFSILSSIFTNTGQQDGIYKALSGLRGDRRIGRNEPVCGVV